MTLTAHYEAAEVQIFFLETSFWLAATNAKGAWIWTAGPEVNLTVPSQLSSEISVQTVECAQYVIGRQINSAPCNTSLRFVIEYECDLTSPIDACHGTLTW